MQTKKLNDGVEIPVYGFGTFQIPADGSTYKAVREALNLGIRHIDTAVAYFNEQEVGQAIRESGIPRERIFVTSKLWLQDYGYEPAKKGIETSLRKSGLDYMDLYLIHQPYGDVPGAWGPLGQGNKEMLADPVIVKIAEAHGKEVRQIILRFEHQEGAIIFPKSTNPERMKSNMEIFDFELSEEEMNAIRALDTGKGCRPYGTEH